MLRPGRRSHRPPRRGARPPGRARRASGELAATSRVLLEATLRRGSLGPDRGGPPGARLPSDENVLIVVDQFEELFRFRRSRQIAELARRGGRASSSCCSKPPQQTTCPIYVVLTMRSDFIGDCMEYPGPARGGQRRASTWCRA